MTGTALGGTFVSYAKEERVWSIEETIPRRQRIRDQLTFPDLLRNDHRNRGLGDGKREEADSAHALTDSRVVPCAVLHGDALPREERFRLGRERQRDEDEAKGDESRSSQYTGSCCPSRCSCRPRRSWRGCGCGAGHRFHPCGSSRGPTRHRQSRAQHYRLGGSS